ncbi:hypothetical protein ANANG_G00189550 [Anguilla anguilla]|uniref:Niemann-Pick C1 N-terminal domain-containing protein n=1 Tax=Anguilla anguilla TaxID=7936 RepID=A0A9D3RRR1_ANGAN|nr:hypothetical protein ANANG_G00189550 [Anguilla anguilla]
MTRTVALVFLSLFACWAVSEAQLEPGICKFYEECGKNPLVNGSLFPSIIPCVDNNKARKLEGLHYMRLKKVCPMLDNGANNTYACCSLNQLASLENCLTLSKALLMRCPSCAENFAHLHCINTCSPDQSQTVNITRTTSVDVQNQTKEAVQAYQAYVSTRFAYGSFNSCRNVRIPATGGFAIATMCGPYGATLCTPQRWYDFQGDSSNGLAPLDIDFRLIPEGAPVPPGIVPYAGRVLGCNESSEAGGKPCSCQDCVQSCPVIPPPPLTGKPFMIGGTD